MSLPTPAVDITRPQSIDLGAAPGHVHAHAFAAAEPERVAQVRGHVLAAALVTGSGASLAAQAHPPQPVRTSEG